MLAQIRAWASAWLCCVALFAAVGVPLLALEHAESHRHHAAPRVTVICATSAAADDEHECVLCQLLAATLAPADLPDGASFDVPVAVASTLLLPPSRGPPAPTISAAPLARGPPSAG
jgi:hypothetical protein